MMNEFFDGNCNILACDIDESSETYIKDIDAAKFFHVDASKEDSLIALKNEIDSNGGADIIIDDASHQPAHQYISLINFSKCLNKGGIFIMEDLHTSFDHSFTNIFYDTPLMFLSGLKFNNFFFSEEEYHDLVNNIEDIITYSHRNDTPKMSGYNFRSVTAVITCKER